MGSEAGATTAVPAVFVSHGSPTVLVDDCPARDFLHALADFLPRPRAILCASAHWETGAPAVGVATRPATIHDFRGFPEELYARRYAVPGAPAVARQAAALLESAGMPCALDAERGLDHGAWVPLLLAWPDADIPVAQVALQHHLGPDHHLAMGRALAPLRDDGVLVLGSGSATHNLREVFAAFGDGAPGAATPAWARDFDDWLCRRVEEGDHAALAAYRSRAPHAEHAHPRDEHLLPLLVAAGAGGGAGRPLHRSFTFGSLSMAAYRFD